MRRYYTSAIIHVKHFLIAIASIMPASTYKITVMKNVSAEQITHFNAQAHQWWDPEGPLATLHHITPARIEFILRNCDVRDKTVVDLGCGGGLVSEALTEHGAKVTGIDLAEEALTVARLHALEQELEIDYQCIDVTDYATHHPASFDVVTCLDMLEHVPDPAAIIKATSDLLKPGGWAFFSTLNRTLKAKILAIGAAEYVLGIVPKGTHRFEDFIKPHELEHWARHNSLTLKDESGLCYNPLFKQATLCDDLSINYLMAFQKDA